MMKRLSLSYVILGMLMIFTSCSNQMRNIPAGYVGKILTPTGWEKGIHEAGQVDIGMEQNAGSNQLVLLEATTTTVKEEFLSSGTKDDNADHRVRTKDGTPLAVDMYVQIAIPTDQKARDGIYSTNTAAETKVNRVSIIEVEDVYNKFAHLTIRGSVRAIFARYKDVDDVMLNYDKINAQIAAAAIDAVKQSNAPFDILGAQLSNVKEDPEILKSKNAYISTVNQVKSINDIGEAIRKNPEYLKARKYDVMEKIGMNSKSDLVLIDMNDSKQPGLNISQGK